MAWGDRAKNPPSGQCRQCWEHAYDSSIHRRQRQQGIKDCAACISHMRQNGGCPDHMIVR